MALKGNLTDFGTTQLLNLVYLAKKTGTLNLSQNSNVADLFFNDGKLVFANLTGQDSSLTGMLTYAGKLSPGQARAIQQRAKEKNDKRLAMILIQNGYVSKEDVVQSATKFVLSIIYRLFTWTDGQFFFHPDKKPQKTSLTVPIDLGNVIMEGSRRVQELERLQDELPDLDMALKFTDRPDAKLRNISLSKEEWNVINYVKPSNSIRRIAQVNKMNDFQIRRIVYGMLQAGLVELVRPPNMVVERKQSNSRVSRAHRAQKQEPAVKRGIVNRLISRISKL